MLENGQHPDRVAAEAAYRSVLEANPAHRTAAINLVAMFIDDGRNAEAIELLRQSIQHGQDTCKLRFLLAFTLRLDDQFDEAIAVLKMLVDETSDVAAWEMLGRCFVESKQMDAAVAHYERWLSVQPGQPVAQHMLAALQGGHVPGRAEARYVVDVFDAFAETFEPMLRKLEYRGPTAVAEILSYYLPDAQPKSLRVLDAGCGTGLIGPVLQEYARELTGVDLSPAMLAMAEQKHIYDSLICKDLEDYLQGQLETFDLIVAADTFIYFGDLSRVLKLSLEALRADGWLIFSVEEGPLAEDHYFLQPHGRYAHSPQYLMDLLVENGIHGGYMNRVALRKEGNKPVFALLIAAQRVP
ncbi:MAG: methyltransferase domain-containing protein [Pirellulaceae bacterium]